MKYVKKYTLKKREELGGFPHKYAFNETRFQMLSTVKLIDFLIGIIGWLNVSTYFGANYVGLNDSVKSLITVTTACLIVTDIWCPILFSSLFYLIYTYNELDLSGELSDSDDSEIDELGLRGPGVTPGNRYVYMREFLFAYLYIYICRYVYIY
jgi:hypothetical protein